MYILRVVIDDEHIRDDFDSPVYFYPRGYMYWGRNKITICAVALARTAEK